MNWMARHCQLSRTALPGAYELHASQSDGAVTYRPDQDCCPVHRERPHWRALSYLDTWWCAVIEPLLIRWTLLRGRWGLVNAATVDQGAEF